MVDSKEITVTDDRLMKALSEPVNHIINSSVPQKIEKVSENLKTKTGVITKFYPYLDKAEVQLDNSNKKVICKPLHRFGGDLIDFYTPLADERSFCDDLKEPCIIPKAHQHVFIIDVPDKDFDLILGYFVDDEETIGFNPAAPGNLKLISVNETNVYWLKFGRDGFEYRLPSTPTMSVGKLDEEMEDFDYADSSNVYTKDELYSKEEVYTKEEVDELIALKVAEAIAELKGEDNDDIAG